MDPVARFVHQRPTVVDFPPDRPAVGNSGGRVRQAGVVRRGRERAAASSGPAAPAVGVGARRFRTGPAGSAGCQFPIIIIIKLVIQHQEIKGLGHAVRYQSGRPSGGGQSRHQTRPAVPPFRLRLPQRSFKPARQFVSCSSNTAYLLRRISF